MAQALGKATTFAKCLSQRLSAKEEALPSAMTLALGKAAITVAPAVTATFLFGVPG